MRDVAERVGQRPCGERVGGEARVDDAQRGLDALVLQVQIEVGELLLGEHALVDEGARAQRREVHRLGTQVALAGALRTELVFATLAHHEALTLERQAGQELPARARGLDEDLVDGGLRVT